MEPCRPVRSEEAAVICGVRSSYGKLNSRVLEAGPQLPWRTWWKEKARAIGQRSQELLIPGIRGWVKGLESS